MVMVLGADLFGGDHFKMRTLNCNTNPFVYRWLMLGKTQMAVNSLLQLRKLVGLMEGMLFLVKSLKENKLLKQWKQLEVKVVNLQKL